MTPLSLDTIPIPDFERLLAAQARQIFRAVNAMDEKATEESTFQFLNLLVCFLPRHLVHDARWGKNNSFLDCFCGAPLEIVSPYWLRVSDNVAIMCYDPQTVQGSSGYSCLKKEPFEFEMELCDRTGSLLGYSMRFGDCERFNDDSASRAEKDKATTWAFSFQRGASRTHNDMQRVLAKELRYLHHDGRIGFAPLESIDALTDAESLHDESSSRTASMSYLCDLIGIAARQLSRAYAAEDVDAIDLTIRGLQHYVKAAISFRDRTT